jgi:hypothetical protein
MRCALLELAVVALKQDQPTRVAACLRSAHAVASKADSLLLSGHTLAPVAVAGVPGWAAEYVRGQEAAFAVSQVGGCTEVCKLCAVCLPLMIKTGNQMQIASTIEPLLLPCCCLAGYCGASSQGPLSMLLILHCWLDQHASASASAGS